MKALSVKQPWADLIARGEKTIEVRGKATKHRGPLLIVASKRPDVWATGFASAVVDLVDCRPMARADEGAALDERQTGAKAWVLRNPRRVEPVPVTGRLGVYDVGSPASCAATEASRSCLMRGLRSSRSPPRSGTGTRAAVTARALVVGKGTEDRAASWTEAAGAADGSR